MFRSFESKFLPENGPDRRRCPRWPRELKVRTIAETLGEGAAIAWKSKRSPLRRRLQQQQAEQTQYPNEGEMHIEHLLPSDHGGQSGADVKPEGQAERDAGPPPRSRKLPRMTRRTSMSERKIRKKAIWAPPKCAPRKGTCVGLVKCSGSDNHHHSQVS